ncbi:MAG TPA: four helix bundle protein [bacterium]|nr:four helix bundle protein [bacterium]
MAEKIKKFEDLNVWKESMQLAVRIYEVLADCRDYGLRDQMQRAAVSAPSNIAEGFERKSNKEFIQHLYIAQGSNSELRTQLYLALRLEIIEKSKANILLEHSRKISAMLYKLIATRVKRFS